MRFLYISIVLSLVLTLVLNVAVRTFPDAGERGARRLDRWSRTLGSRNDGRQVYVYFPWKAMLLVSIVLTVVVSLAFR